MRTGRSTAVRAGLLVAAFGLLALALPRVGHAAGRRVSARLDRPRIGLGETAELALTVEGVDGAQPDLPRVAGLHFDYAGQSSRMHSVNGATSISQTLHYRVHADRVGSFRIPPIEVRAAGRILRTEAALDLEVVAGAGPSKLQRGRLPSSSPPSQAAPSASRAEASGAFLRLVADRKNPFVGEVVPVEVQAWFPAGTGASIDSNLRAEGNAFTLETGDGEVEQTRQRYEGRVYDVLTWFGALSPVKEGRHALRVELDATVRVRERAQQRRRVDPLGGLLSSSLFDDDFFGDDFFADFFGGLREQKVVLKSEALDLDGRALPTENRPAHYRGAVGRFEIEAEVEEERVAVGDPVTVRSTVRGIGNFDRVTAPVLESADGWKTYDADGEMRALDGVGRVGEKRFEQVVVPNDPTLVAVPPLVFSYFDPEREDFVTIQTDPVPLAVDGSVRGSRPRAGMDAPASVVEVTDDGLLPDRAVRSHSVSSLDPLILHPAYIALVALGVLGLAFGVVLTHRRLRLEGDPALQRRRRADRTVGKARDVIERAADDGDGPAFFEAARGALQERLGERWACAPETITLSDLRARWPDAPESIRSVFEAFDAAAYAGRATNGWNDLTTWRERVHDALRTLEDER